MEIHNFTFYVKFHIQIRLFWQIKFSLSKQKNIFGLKKIRRSCAARTPTSASKYPRGKKYNLKKKCVWQFGLCSKMILIKCVSFGKSVCRKFKKLSCRRWTISRCIWRNEFLGFGVNESVWVQFFSLPLEHPLICSSS